MTNLNALADRVEEARGGDRRLNAEIDIAINGFPERAYQQRMGMRSKGTPETDRVDWMIEWGATAYTTSLDAALTLLPEGCEWARWSPGSMIVVFPPPHDDEKGWAKTIESRGATPALALTAACLRARATGGSHG